jgi:2-phospho-L-lactate guanylyltransferase
MTAHEPEGSPGRLAAIIPVGTIEGAKTRLGGTLDAEERQDLVERLLDRTVAAALAVQGIDDVLVISPDREVLRRASDLGARTLRQRSTGLNAGLADARADVVAGGAEAILVLPIDLALVSTAALEDVLAPIAGSGRDSAADRTVVLVPDRHGTGTNALALRPPEVITFAFGPNSRDAHRGAAQAVGATYLEVTGPLTFDIDTPADLVLVDSLRAEETSAG